MTVARQGLIIALVLFAIAESCQKIASQAAPPVLPSSSPQVQPVPASANLLAPTSLSPESSVPFMPSLHPLLNFKDSDIKFNLQTLMNTLRDSKHEGWILAAYPDPKTSRPLIGAGFGLDVVATEHPQRDPLNPNLFTEPSTAQLWQAAGLEAAQLQAILDRFDRNMKVWTKKNYRKKIRTHALPPELTNEEATRLLRISSVQSVQNARAYCRNFDGLTASQQMALSHLVFQMGVNLEEFVQFLSVINNDLQQPNDAVETEADHWKTVQRTLIESEWARRYTSRATTVIAMFDPEYAQNPRQAERRVQAVLHPPSKHHRRKGHSSPSKRKLA